MTFRPGLAVGGGAFADAVERGDETERIVRVRRFRRRVRVGGYVLRA